MDLDSAVDILVRATGDLAYRDRARAGPAWEAAILRAAARLAQGPPPPRRPPAPGAAPILADRELVVARYKEDLSWLHDAPCRAVVYNNGAPLARALPDRVRVVDRPNVGREAGPFAEHWAGRYDDLAPLTITCQGWPFDHCPDFLDRVRAPWDRPTSLAPRYTDSWPPPAIKAGDRIERRHGFELRLGDAFLPCDPGQSGSSWVDLANWGLIFACPPPRPWWFGYSATWAVPAAAIRARPRSFWRWLSREIQAAGTGRDARSAGLNPWFMEAAWNYIYADPSEYPHRPECSA